MRLEYLAAERDVVFLIFSEMHQSATNDIVNVGIVYWGKSENFQASFFYFVSPRKARCSFHFFVIFGLISITVFKASNSRLSIAIQTYCCWFVIIPRFYEYSRKAECITELAAPSLSQRDGTFRVRYSNKILKIHPTALSLQFFFKSADYEHSVARNYAKGRK